MVSSAKISKLLSLEVNVKVGRPKMLLITKPSEHFLPYLIEMITKARRPKLQWNRINS